MTHTFRQPEVFRVPPKVDDTNEHFWRGGAEGELRFLRCQACGHWLHPPTPACRVCLSRDLRVEAASGRGTVFSFTRNHQPWNPTMSHPYVIAVVQLDEGPRLLTNLVDCDPSDAAIGLAVEVCFEVIGEGEREVHLPQFRPVGAQDG